MISTAIFDLDGVVVDTAKYHYLAWRELADGLGFEFTPEQGEATKGVSRMASLDIVLRAGGMEDQFTAAEKQSMAAAKNSRYVELVGQMDRSEVLPGVLDFIADLRSHQVKIVLGSASRNAGLILDRCGLRPLFDAVVDGTLVTKAKPDPEIFLEGARAVGAPAACCVVFEDAKAGIEAATRAQMRSVGVGMGAELSAATTRIGSFEELSYDKLIDRIDRKN